MDLIEHNIKKTQPLRLAGIKQKVEQGKYYKTTFEFLGKKGQEYSAYVGIVLQDSENKEILRRVIWLNDFSGFKKMYTIICRAEPKTSNMTLIARANCDNTNNSDLQIQLSKIEGCPIAKSEEQEEKFDELYDCKLMWARRKNVKSEDWERIGQSKEQFYKGGEAVLSMLKLCGFTQDSKILDIGCGFGRTANALEPFLSYTGKYYGIDIGEESIEYCKKNYQRKNFNFIKNMDNIIPEFDEKFEFVLFVSVFTHLYPNEICEFLQQLKTKLTDNGKIIADILERNDLQDYSGTRGRMFYNLEFIKKIINKEGFKMDVIHITDGSKWGATSRPFIMISK